MSKEYEDDFISTCKDGSRIRAAKEKWIIKQRKKCSDIPPAGIKDTVYDRVFTADLKMENFIQLLNMPNSENHKRLFVYDYENRLHSFLDSLIFLCAESKELKQILYRVRLLSNPEKLYIDLKFPDNNEIKKIKGLVNKTLEEYKSLWKETLINPDKESEKAQFCDIGKRVVEGGRKGGQNNSQKELRMEKCYELYDEQMSARHKLPETEIKKVIASTLRVNPKTVNRYLAERTNETK